MNCMFKRVQYLELLEYVLKHMGLILLIFLLQQD